MIVKNGQLWGRPKGEMSREELLNETFRQAMKFPELMRHFEKFTKEHAGKDIKILSTDVGDDSNPPTEAEWEVAFDLEKNWYRPVIEAEIAGSEDAARVAEEERAIKSFYHNYCQVKRMLAENHRYADLKVLMETMKDWLHLNGFPVDQLDISYLEALSLRKN